MVSQPGKSRLALLAVAAGVALGVGLRMYVLSRHTGGFDSDEAVTGLMARHLLSDPLDHQAFYWGTNYGGTLAAVVAALPLWLFGWSVTALKLTEVAWHAVAALLVWRIGRRLVDERAGVVAGVIVWVWPALAVQWSTKARGFYGTLEVLGLVLLLCALRLADRPDSRTDWLVLGIAAGLGWWTNPQIAYLAVPAGIWLVVRNREALASAFRAKAWLLALPGFIVGALPWIYWNALHHWRSLGGDANPGINRAEGFDGHFWRFVREGLPVTLGLRTPHSYEWTFSPSALAKALYLGALVAIAVALLVRGRRQGALLLAIALLMYPVLHALGPVAGFTAEGRYFFCYTPLLALALARLARTRLAIGLLFPVLVASTLTGLWNIPPGNAGATSGKVVPESLAPLISSLEAERVNAVFANYWIAYRLTFESRERVIASGTDTERYAPYGEIVRRSPSSGWVFLEDTLAEMKFLAALDRLGVERRLWRTGGFSVYVPATPVHPEQLLPAEAS
jgi:4-amino-4-deoxy-L-arabinose transferase-like glycosyltransferase